jgi:hypothetical protein
MKSFKERESRLLQPEPVKLCKRLLVLAKSVAKKLPLKKKRLKESQRERVCHKMPPVTPTSESKLFLKNKKVTCG